MDSDLTTINTIGPATARALIAAGIPDAATLRRVGAHDAYRAMLVDVRTKVAAGVRAGRTKAQVVASNPTAPYTGIATTGFITPTRFVEGIYDEVKARQPRQPRRR